MMELRLKPLAMALAAAFLLGTGAGCSGGEPYDDVECTDGQVRNQDTGVCEAPPADECEDVTCDDGKTCNPNTGECVAGGNCANVTCDEYEECNPANGQCESKCKPGTCSAKETCVPTTGECVPKCESSTKPTGKPECGAGQRCDDNTGTCVSACQGVTCPYAQFCEPSTGQCKPKSGPGAGQLPEGYPGTACNNAEDCFNPDFGGTQECLDEFVFTTANGTLVLPAPEGYCTSACNPNANDCPQGSVCLGLCVSLCARDADCRDGYRCTPIGAGQAACLGASACEADDPAECGGIGADCEVDGDCIDGAECLAETGRNNLGQEVYTGFAGGYCAWTKFSADTCPDGSTGLLASSDDPSVEICLKDCEFGVVGSCSLDESCQPVAINQQTGVIEKAVCLYSDCSVHEDCHFAQCTAQDTRACGVGQDCLDDKGAPVTGQTIGTCSTRDRCGGSHGACRNGVECVDGLCAQSFCEPTLGLCKYDCNIDPELKLVDGQWISPIICGDGATCDTATGACVRGCIDDTSCGPNAVCGEDGQCVAHCTRWNEDRVCGDSKVCNYDTGHCHEPCTAGSCGTGEVCVEDTGRCQRSCNAALDPRTCAANEFCDDGGFCQTKCTASNELTVCSPTNADPEQRTYCQASTGKCLPSCADDPSICGEEACSVASTSGVARCGQTCSTSQNCGRGGYNEFLTCQGPAGSRTCAPLACDDENACPAGSFCVNNVCEATCTSDDQCGPGRVCGEESLCEEAPEPTCDVDPDVCAENEYCDAGECVLRCDAAAFPGCDTAEYCDTASGQCELRCDAAGGEACVGDDVCHQQSGQCGPPCNAAGEFTICDEEDFFCDTETGACSEPL